MRAGVVLFCVLLLVGCKKDKSIDADGKTNAIPLDLPKAVMGEQLSAFLSVDLRSDGTRWLNGLVVKDDADLRDRAKAEVAKYGPDLRVVIRADRAVRYDEVIRAIDLVKQAGVSKFALAVEPMPAPR